jgi:3',5'-cyclic AMP phosphodiesterase CpdA
MSVLLQISDPHFGTEQAPVVAALRHLHEQLKPDVVVVSGDITQRARRSQFAAARKFLDELNIRALVIIPGNHDIPLFNLLLRAFAPYANYARAFGNNLQPDFVSNELLVVGLNTTRPGRHTDGEVSALQIDYVCERLRQALPGQLRVVVVHQPVHVITRSDRKNLLHGHSEATRAWAKAGADLIMGGHIHLPYVRLLDRPEPQLTRPLWAVQAGTSLSSRVRGGISNSVNVVRYDNLSPQRLCIVEQWDFNAGSGAFQPVQHIPVELSAYR